MLMIFLCKATIDVLEEYILKNNKNSNILTNQTIQSGTFCTSYNILDVNNQKSNIFNLKIIYTYYQDVNMFSVADRDIKLLEKPIHDSIFFQNIENFLLNKFAVISGIQYASKQLNNFSSKENIITELKKFIKSEMPEFFKNEKNLNIHAINKYKSVINQSKFDLYKMFADESCRIFVKNI